MVVKEDGTKWACQSCLKGHRVSQCTHKDRDLSLVPKKGRPITQCQHCRQERKKRSAHVKCECGETDKQHHPKEKCIHLREAEEKAKAALLNGTKTVPTKTTAEHLVAVAEEQGCCCHHGGKCACATLKLKKEPTDDETSSTLHGPAVKPRLDTTKSDGSITVFSNGHHKPVHRKNHAAHESGMPYKMPMSRAHTDRSVPAAARRSVDSLVLDSNTPFPPFAFTRQSASSQSTQSKSEHGSPKLSPIANGMTSLVNSDPTTIDFASMSQFRENEAEFNFPPLDPTSGLTDESFDPWSAVPSADPNVQNNPLFTSAWATSNDNLIAGQPALTNASSNTQSEIDEIPVIDETLGFTMPSIQEDLNDVNYNFFSTGSPQTNRRSLPPGFFGNLPGGTANASNDWQNAFGSFSGADTDKQRSQNTGQSNSFDQSWQMPTFQPANDNVQRTFAAQNPVGRPQSLSVGPGNAPSDEIFRQLFPDIDVDGSVFPPATYSQDMMSDNANIKDLDNLTASAAAASAGSEYGPLDDTNDLNVRAWINDPTNMPLDIQNDAPFTSLPPYDIPQRFANPSFLGDWIQ